MRSGEVSRPEGVVLVSSVFTSSYRLSPKVLYNQNALDRSQSLYVAYSTSRRLQKSSIHSKPSKTQEQFTDAVYNRPSGGRPHFPREGDVQGLGVCCSLMLSGVWYVVTVVVEIR